LLRNNLGERVMIVTVCELPDDRKTFEDGWVQLAEHVKRANSSLVVLPDMPFSPWCGDSLQVEAARWSEAVAAHDAWEHRLGELGAALVLGSRPIDFGNERYDEGFVWEAETGVRSVHSKASRDFVPLEIHGVDIGFLIGSEVSARQARPYGPGEVDVVAMPRCTRSETFAQRLAHACSVATETGAFALSSNRSAPFEGQGWIVAPDGRVLGTTSRTQPFVSLEIALPSERTSADRSRGRPAPDWMDPLDTGVPNYD
jgi:N-carbamoylputrescine amidase